MKNFIKGVLMFIVMVIMSGCGSRAGESSDNLHKREPRTKKRIYAREVLVENLDYPMLPCAYYSNDKPLYGKDNQGRRKEYMQGKFWWSSLLIQCFLVHTIILVVNHFMAKIKNTINFPTER